MRDKPLSEWHCAGMDPRWSKPKQRGKEAMDTLQKRHFNGRNAPEWANFVARHRGRWYWEESLKQQNGKRFQSIVTASGGITPPRYDDNTSRGWDKAYQLPAIPKAPEISAGGLYSAQWYADGEMPPVPTSELYVSVTGLRTASLRLEQTSISIGTNASGLRVRMSVETARAMASDLIRMAAELERQENAE